MSESWIVVFREILPDGRYWQFEWGVRALDEADAIDRALEAMGDRNGNRVIEAWAVPLAYITRYTIDPLPRPAFQRRREDT